MILWAAILVMQPLLRGIQHGFPYALGNFSQRQPLTPGEQRLVMVCNNQLEALGLLLPAIFLLIHLDISSQRIFYAAYTYTLVRVLYTFVSLAGIPVIRSGLWAISLLAWIYMVWPLVGVF